jgi:hypothetical protein
MTTLRLLLLASLIVVFPAVASEPATSSGSVSGEDALSADTCQQNVSRADSGIIAQRGCCSWHEGICGCSGVLIVCCDGSFSPSCRCNGGSQDLGPIARSPKGVR